MSTKLKLLAAGSSITLAVLGSSSAFAAGTVAGTVITNTATVNYTVGGVAQTALSASNNLTVDRKIVVTAIETDAAAVSVTPGQVNSQTKWSITNSSNATIDINLAAAAIASGTTISIPGATTAASAFTVGAATFTYTQTSSGTTYLVTAGGPYLDEVPPDTTVTITVTDTSAIPLTATNGQYGGVSLTASALQGGTAATKGGAITNNASQTWGGYTANSVFAESATTYTGVTDPKWDGQYIAVDAYIISAPVLTVAKTSYVVWDPINGTTSPKAIPGAEVRYCISVANAAGGATATAPTVSDNLTGLPVTYVTGSTFINGTATGATCNTGAFVNGANTTAATGSGASGATGGSFASNTVSGTLANLAAGSTETLYFDVTIN